MFESIEKIPKNEIENRISRLKESLRKNKIDSALIVQPTDLFYFSGTIQAAHLYVPVDGSPLLMVRKSYERACHESGVDKIIPLKSPNVIPEILKDHQLSIPEKIGMELDVLPANLFLSYKKIFSVSNIEDISHIIRSIRAVKSSMEIKTIKEAAELGDKVFEQSIQFFRKGITEIELAGRIESIARSLGHQGIVRMRLWGNELFYGHLMAGANAAVPSYLSSPTGGASVSTAVAQGPSFRPIEPNEPILVDYVFAYKGYLSDCTRIFSLGKLPEKLNKAHQSMLAISELIKKAAMPSVSCESLYEMALERAASDGYSDYFMGVGDKRVRFIGHGVGLEIDEYPFLAKGQKSELKEGMVIALEPKAVFPNIGVVGIENTHLVTPRGLRQLNHYREEITII